MRTGTGIGIALMLVTLAAPAGFAQKMAQKDASYLGVGVQDVDADRAKALKMKEEHGAEITQLDPEGPAFRAGVKPGDVVLEYNGTPVQGFETLQRLVRETPPGHPVKLLVWRNGASLTLTAVVAKSKGLWLETPAGDVNVVIPPIPPMPPSMPRMLAIMPTGRLGIEGEPLCDEPQFADFMGVKDGVLVKAVNRNSAAERAGIKAGDVIVKVDDTHVSDSSDITSALRASRSKRTFTVTLVRSKKEMPVTVTFEER